MQVKNMNFIKLVMMRSVNSKSMVLFSHSVDRKLFLLALSCLLLVLFTCLPPTYQRQVHKQAHRHCLSNRVPHLLTVV